MSRSFSSAMDDMRNSVSYLPEDNPNWRRDLEELLYRDLLTITNGNEEKAVLCFIDFMAAELGETIFRLGVRGIQEFNKAFARHEKMKLHLGHGIGCPRGAWGQDGQS